MIDDSSTRDELGAERREPPTISIEGGRPVVRNGSRRIPVSLKSIIAIIALGTTIVSGLGWCIFYVGGQMVSPGSRIAVLDTAILVNRESTTVVGKRIVDLHLEVDTLRDETEYQGARLDLLAAIMCRQRQRERQAGAAVSTGDWVDDECNELRQPPPRYQQRRARSRPLDLR